MKRLVFISIILFGLIACTSAHKAKVVKQEVKEYAIFGEKITSMNAISQQEMLAKYKKLNIGDTIEVKFISKVNSVCQKKGCWARLVLDDNLESFVKFKDYAFFVPKDAAGSEAIVRGKAYLQEVSVRKQKHYAKEQGLSKEEIDAITEPKLHYLFMADGVLLR